MAVESSGAMAMATNMLWRTVGFLSVTLQRQNFLVLSGCVPVLAGRVTGQLGRPLSEIPEFWRAAPDAPGLWGARRVRVPAGTSRGVA